MKLVQLRGLRGEHGGWIDFLAVCNQKASTPSNLSMVSRDLLVAFLTTFKKKEDLKVLFFVVITTKCLLITSVGSKPIHFFPLGPAMSC